MNKTVTDYLSGHSNWQLILKKVTQLQTLSKQILPCLETNLAKNCQVANIIGNKLILIAENGSIATQIRYQAGLLLMKFSRNPQLRHIQQIECKVRPPLITDTLTPVPPLQLSAEAADAIRNVAQGLTDLDLKKILHKIAKHGTEAK